MRSVFALYGAMVLVPVLVVQTPVPPSIDISPSLPIDLPMNASQADAVTFAWQSFVALNWPVLATARGIPDTSRRIGQPGPVVWHTWKQIEEVFLPDGGVPASWGTYGSALPHPCGSLGADAAQPGDLVLMQTSKVRADANGNNALELANEVVGGSLTDQHGNLARFEIRFNKTQFDTIVANRFYNTQGQDAAKVIRFPSGVMEVKASWRMMTTADSPEVRARFLRRDAWIYTPASGTTPATCTKSVVGLTGLHITQKTPTRPQWVWATFEHVDNVPPFGATPPPARTLPYSFFDPLCPVTQCPPNQSTEEGRSPATPTQVTRIINIGAAAAKANPRWQAALATYVAGSPFQHYQLVDVQWPQDPAQRPIGNPTPSLLANTTMETYIPESSCINCHYTARTQSGKLSSDFTFVLGHAQPAQGGR